MNLSSILQPGSAFCGAPGTSKKRTLEVIADFIASQHDELNSEDIFMRLIERERLGSTGLGNGIAIPHSRMPDIEDAVAALITLDTPIDFEAIDEQPVDLLFVLLVPEESTQEHLNILAMVAGLFDQADFRDKLRAADSDTSLYEAAINFASNA